MRSGPLKSHETLRVVARIRGSDVSERKRVRDKFGFYKTFMTESFSDVDNVHEAFDFLSWSEVYEQRAPSNWGVN